MCVAWICTNRYVMMDGVDCDLQEGSAFEKYELDFGHGESWRKKGGGKTGVEDVTIRVLGFCCKCEKR